MGRRLLFLLAAVFAALVAASSASTYSSNTTIDATATWLAMRPVTVRCLTQQESDEDWVILYGAAAYVEGTFNAKGRWVPFDYSVFMYGICETIEAYQLGEPVLLKEFAWAVLVLTHESGHLRGWKWASDEARTECWAIRHTRYVAQHLGMTDPAALSAVMTEALRLHNEMGWNYHLAGCKLPTP